MRRSVWLVPVLLLTLPAPAQQDASAQWFSLTSNRVVEPGQEARVEVDTQNVTQLEFRLYRVNNPVLFYRQLDEENRFGGTPRAKGRPRTFLEKFLQWKGRTRAALRDTVRYQFSPDHRAFIRKRMSGEPKPQAVPAGKTFAGIPVLNSQQLVRSWRQAIVKKTRWDSLTVPVRLEESGLYVVEATSGDRTAYTIVSATRIAMIAKGAPNRVLARVVDASSGAPLEGVAVTIIDSRERQDLSTLNTDASGLVEQQIQNPAEEGVRLIACRGKDCALQHVSGWALGLNEARSLTGVVYTDRPVYRPGHKVYFRALARQRDGQEYAVPRLEPVSFLIRSPRGEQLLRQDASLSSLGTASGEFTLPAGATPGYYSIQLKAGEAQVYGGFEVEEYRKPEYEVRITPAAARVLQGARTRVSIQARYFYGEPVQGAAVKYSVRRGRAYFWFDPDWNETPLDDAEPYAYGTEQLEEKAAKLNAEGVLEIEVPTVASDEDERYVVEARVTDSAGREISGMGGFLATRGDFLLSVSANGYVYAPSDPVRLNVKAYDFSGKPSPDIDVRATLTEWVSRDKQNRLTRAPWTQSYAGRVGADGTGVIAFPAPDSGSYSVTVAALGSRVTAESHLYVSGGLGWGENAGEIRIIPDRTRYRAGDTAKFLIVAPEPGAHVWFTLEGAKLLHSQMLQLKGATATVQLPVTKDWEPNVFAEASAMQKREFVRGSTMLRVPAVRKNLTVALSSDKQQYLPGEQAEIQLTVKDSGQQPVQGEFSLGVVDEAIYAIRPDRLEDLSQIFYGRMWNRVQTGDSMSLYFHGQSGRRRILLAGGRPAGLRGQLKPPPPVQPKVRKLFPDTAYWIANLKTGPDGVGRATFTWPDALTTWRATARGVASETRVGNATMKTIVRKNLMLTLATPRFFTEGDEVDVPLIVRNYYDTPQRVELSLESRGASIVKPAGAAAEIPARGEQKLEARLRPEAGVTLLAKALNPVESDALELQVPFVLAGVPVSGAKNVTVSGDAQFDFQFPSGDNQKARSLRLQLAPSVASAVFASLEYLVNYPYGCVEQTMSSLLPNLAVAEAVRLLKLPPPVPAERLGKLVASGLRRLAGFQHPDGGWGWWRGDDSHPFLTAYVVLGLHLAAEQGMNTEHAALARGLRALQAQFDSSEPMDADTRAWQLHALAGMKLASPPRLERVWRERDKLSSFGLALLGLSLHASSDPRAADVAAMVESRARRGPAGVWWESSHDPLFYASASYDHEATAFSVRFLALAKPESKLIDEAARWLVQGRAQGYYWETTKRTALVVFGLTPYLARSGDLESASTAVLKVNGTRVAEERFAPGSGVVTIDVPANTLQSSNQVRVEMSGQGRLWLSANWSTRSTAPPAQSPTGNGLSIDRRYYRLTPVRQGGKVTWDPQPLTGPAQPGDLLGVRLAVRCDSDRQYLLIEDPLPSGTEIVRNEELYEITNGRSLFRDWWSRREERDERVTFFPSLLRKGESTFSYLLKVTHQGRFQIAPARIEPMYEPGVVSVSPAAVLEVKQP